MIFHITLEQAEDGWIVAECPALPGCVSQGRDEKEALDNIKEAIKAWLWAEDQKAVQSLTFKPGQMPVWSQFRIMGRLANISGKGAVRAFDRAGWIALG